MFLKTLQVMYHGHNEQCRRLTLEFKFHITLYVRTVRPGTIAGLLRRTRALLGLFLGEGRNSISSYYGSRRSAIRALRGCIQMVNHCVQHLVSRANSQAALVGPPLTLPDVHSPRSILLLYPSSGLSWSIAARSGRPQSFFCIKNSNGVLQCRGILEVQIIYNSM